jgi:hypothetical protein
MHVIYISINYIINIHPHIIDILKYLKCVYIYRFVDIYNMLYANYIF